MFVLAGQMMQLCIHLKKNESFQHGGGTSFNAEVKEQVGGAVQDANKYLVHCMNMKMQDNSPKTTNGVDDQWQHFLKEMEGEGFELTRVHYNGAALFDVYDSHGGSYRLFSHNLKKALINYASSLGKF